MGISVSRFSVFEDENRIGIQRNCRILYNGRPITDVQVADSVRGMVKMLARDASGSYMIDRAADAPVTYDLKGAVTIELIDPLLYVKQQRERLDLIERLALLQKAQPKP